MPHALKGRHVIVTSGPTREHIDPVRYISNESSGKQGHAIAEAFAKAGARVTLISGPVSLPDPDGVTTIHVISARDMLAATEAALPADIAVCVAAVADFRPANPAEQKIKKQPGQKMPPIALIENPDILKTIGHHAQRPEIVVGFAAETENLINNAHVKLGRKGADIIMANSVADGAGFAKDDAHLHAVMQSGAYDWGWLSKSAAADKIVSTITSMLKPKIA